MSLFCFQANSPAVEQRPIADKVVCILNVRAAFGTQLAKGLAHRVNVDRGSHALDKSLEVCFTLLLSSHTIFTETDKLDNEDDDPEKKKSSKE
jgi:hypothetical protein